MSQQTPSPLDLSLPGLKVGVVAARFNANWVDCLLDRVVRTLEERGVDAKGIQVERVPGSNELPFAAAALIRSRTVEVVIALGCVLAGETSHHEVIAAGTASAFHGLGIDSGIPVINGVLVTHTPEQMEERVGPAMDRGAEFAHAALEMAALRRRLGGEG